MQMHLCVSLAAAAGGSFEVAWNSPWPSHCTDINVSADVLTRFGVRANENNSFNGGVVSTFYNNPTRMTLGMWPCYDTSAHAAVAINGGLPQLGNLTAHLAKVRKDVATLLPDPNFDGYAVIDWEVWRPWMVI